MEALYATTGVGLRCDGACCAHADPCYSDLGRVELVAAGAGDGLPVWYRLIGVLCGALAAGNTAVSAAGALRDSRWPSARVIANP